MRTTVEVAPAIMRAAKARSAELGESLKALLTRALAAEIGIRHATSSPSARVTLPLFGAPDGARVNLSNADLEAALAGVDARYAMKSASPRRKSRPRR